MRFRFSVICVITLGLLSGCGPERTTKTESVTQSGVTVSGSMSEAPQISFGSDAKDVAQLIVKDVTSGSGTAVGPNSTVTAHYVGYSMSNQEKFDSSWERGEPTTFPLNGVIQGWTQGLQGMKVGGRRLLIIPPELAYGPAGSGHQLAGQTLVFVVDLTAVS